MELEHSLVVTMSVNIIDLIIINKSAVARFARNIILVAQYRNLNRLKRNGF